MPWQQKPSDGFYVCTSSVFDERHLWMNASVGHESKDTRCQVTTVFSTTNARFHWVYRQSSYFRYKQIRSTKYCYHAILVLPYDDCRPFAGSDCDGVCHSHTTWPVVPHQVLTVLHRPRPPPRVNHQLNLSKIYSCNCHPPTLTRTRDSCCYRRRPKSGGRRFTKRLVRPRMLLPQN